MRLSSGLLPGRGDLSMERMNAFPKTIAAFGWKPAGFKHAVVRLPLGPPPLRASIAIVRYVRAHDRRVVRAQVVDLLIEEIIPAAGRDIVLMIDAAEFHFTDPEGDISDRERVQAITLPAFVPYSLKFLAGQMLADVPVIVFARKYTTAQVSVLVLSWIGCAEGDEPYAGKYFVRAYMGFCDKIKIFILLQLIDGCVDSRFCKPFDRTIGACVIPIQVAGAIGHASCSKE